MKTHQKIFKGIFFYENPLEHLQVTKQRGRLRALIALLQGDKDIEQGSTP